VESFGILLFEILLMDFLSYFVMLKIFRIEEVKEEKEDIFTKIAQRNWE
jgi:hypothetical protein